MRGWPFRWIAGVTLAGVTPGLGRLAWLIEVRGLANRTEGFGKPGPVDKSEGLGRAGPAQAKANRSEGFWGNGPRAGRPTLT